MLVYLILASIFLLYWFSANCNINEYFAVFGNPRYADCPPGYINNGTECANLAYKIAASGERIANCPSGYTVVNGQCVITEDTMIPDSRPADCPDGYYKDGNFCKRDSKVVDNTNFRPADCPDTYTKIGDSICQAPESVIPNTNTAPATLNCITGATYDTKLQKCIYDKTSIPNKNIKCPANTVLASDGTYCNPTSAVTAGSCDSGYVKNGSTCYGPCPTDYNRSYDGTTCTLKDNTGFVMSVSCNNPEYPVLNEAKQRENSLCYGVCPDPEYNWTYGKKTCSKPGSKYNKDVMKCNSDEYLYGNKCYKKCTDQSINTGSKCVTFADIIDTNSMICHSGEYLFNGKCYKNCPQGYLQGAGICYRPQSTKGSNVMTCDTDEVLFGNKCYKKCPDGYIQSGNMCTQAFKNVKATCKPYETQEGSMCLSA